MRLSCNEMWINIDVTICHMILDCHRHSEAALCSRAIDRYRSLKTFRPTEPPKLSGRHLLRNPWSSRVVPAIARIRRLNLWRHWPRADHFWSLQQAVNQETARGKLDYLEIFPEFRWRRIKHDQSWSISLWFQVTLGCPVSKWRLNNGFPPWLPHLFNSLGSTLGGTFWSFLSPSWLAPSLSRSVLESSKVWKGLEHVPTSTLYSEIATSGGQHFRIARSRFGASVTTLNSLVSWSRPVPFASTSLTVSALQSCYEVEHWRFFVSTLTWSEIRMKCHWPQSTSSRSFFSHRMRRRNTIREFCERGCHLRFNHQSWAGAMAVWNWWSTWSKYVGKHQKMTAAGTIFGAQSLKCQTSAAPIMSHPSRPRNFAIIDGHFLINNAKATSWRSTTHHVAPMKCNAQSMR